MSARVFRSSVLGVLAVAAACAVRAERIPVQLEGVRLSYTARTSGGSSEGHYVLEIEASNDRSEELAWDVGVSSTRWDSTQVLDGFRLTVPARGKVRVTRFVQKAFLENSYGEAATLSVSGPGGGAVVTIGGSEGNETVMTPDIAEENAERFRSVREKGALASHTPMRRGVSTLEIESKPADWRSFTECGLIVAGRDEWNAFPEAHRRALLRWLVAGGELVLLAPEDEAWQVKDVGSIKPGGLRGVGLGEVRCEQARLSSESGRLRLSDEQLDKLGKRSPIRLFQAPLGRPARMPVLESLPSVTSGLGWNLGFVLVIALLMGPVNFYLLAPAGRRHRLFWTLPATALLVSVAVFVVACLRLGLGSEGNRVALVVLIPGGSEAVVAQEQFVRSGVRLPKAFQLPQTIALHDVTAFGRAVRTGRKLVRHGDQVSGDWFPLNEDRQHALAGIVPMRSRVSVSFQGGAAVARSTFPKALVQFHCRSEDGRLWFAQRVEPGVPVTLSELPGRLPQELAPGARPFTDRGEFSASTEGLENVPIATDPDVRWLRDTVQVIGPFVAAPQEVSP